MNFEDALKELKTGAQIRRAKWSAGEIVILKEGRTRLVDGTRNTTMVWFTQDILSEDWEIA